MASADAVAAATRPWRPALVLLLAGALALAVWATSEWSYQRARQSLNSLDQRATARQSVERILRRLLDAESAQRGYLITARRSYLQPMDEIRADLDRELSRLGGLMQDDAEQNALVRLMGERAIEKLSELDETLAMHAAGQHERWRDLVMSDIGREKMQAVRSAAELLLVAEDRRVAAERAHIARTLAASRVGVHASTLLALVGLILFLRQTASLQAAQKAHAQALQGERDTLDLQVRQRTFELSELNRHLQDVREAERSRLARSLHDDLGALLTAAKLDLARLRRALAASPIATAASAGDVSERLTHLTDTIDQGITIKRILIEDLSPSALHNLGLRAALGILASDFTQRTGIGVRLRAEELELPLSPRIVAFRLVQTCLSNVERHAGVNEVEVDVLGTAGEIVVRVSDQGRGFDPAAVPASQHELTSFRFRVESLGGHLQIRSAPGHGTEVMARIPVRAEPAAEAEATATSSQEGGAC